MGGTLRCAITKIVIHSFVRSFVPRLRTLHQLRARRPTQLGRSRYSVDLRVGSFAYLRDVGVIIYMCLTLCWSGTVLDLAFWVTCDPFRQFFVIGYDDDEEGESEDCA